MSAKISAFYRDPESVHSLIRIHLERMLTPQQKQRSESEIRIRRPAISRSSNSRPRITWAPALIALFLLVCAGAGRLAAQSTFGTILGTVQDNSGAVIPGAKVTAHSLDENADYTATTNGAGDFVFENLKAGHYKVTVQKEGFTDSVVTSATLEARQELRLPITLSVTASATTVEVVADAALMNTENGTLNNTISNVDITQLPINSRSVSSSPLAALAVSPEVTRDSQGNIAVGGATSSQTGFSVDGISTANVRYNGALAGHLSIHGKHRRDESDGLRQQCGIRPDRRRDLYHKERNQ